MLGVWIRVPSVTFLTGKEDNMFASKLEKAEELLQWALNFAQRAEGTELVESAQELGAAIEEFLGE